MKRIMLTLSAIMLFVVLAGNGVFAQAAAPGAAGTPAIAAVPPAPPIGTRAQTIRPVPSILPTLRLIDAGMLPTLSFLLTLTEDQKAKALDLLTKVDEERKPKVAVQTKAAADYIALLGKDNSSQADLTAAAQKVLSADNDLMGDRIKAYIAFRALLTPDQSKLLAHELEQTAQRWLPQSAPTGPPPPPATGK